eukprot:CAMPEP_0197394828 /NCGR_PEP_ID=MMETSP1165-20131217/6192_1 /TAXON_ID=284809 /ORGANISM="Chrysocystis fragilis, Strain CCMP3189" /LENGTH=302 /DNA_ID=CAMNT_0042920567 /DNA_START=71 /DNA_END=978 /DNA_ORIENTATION=+
MTTANASAETKWREEQFFEEATKCGKENDVGAKQCLSRHPAWKGVIMWPQLRLDSWGRVAFDENVELHERRDQSLLTETGEKSLLNCVVAKNPSSSCRPTTPAARALPASSGARPAASTSSSSCPTPRDSSRLSTSTTRGSTRRTALRAPGEERTFNRTLHTADQINILATIWPCKPTDASTLAKVGIEQTHLAPDNNDRSKFIMHSPPLVGKTDEVDLTITSPDAWTDRELRGVAAGRGNYQATVRSEREVDPKEAGIMEMASPIRKLESSSVRITDGHGSAKLSDIPQKAHQAARAADAE